MAESTNASNELGEIAGEAMSLGPRRGAGWMALLLTTCFIGASIADASLPASEDGLEPSTGDEQPAWDVDAPAFSAESKTVPIDVRSGTWMNLDVSPSGDQIVFDLLGDLYLLPIEGGQATSITNGLAWDMQPTFSPDGSHIAFTSDRAGGDNIWTIGVSDGVLRQVTDESFRLMNNPAWHPGGKRLVAKKHFATSRSLGPGEI